MTGTIINIVAVIVGGSIGSLLGDRLRTRTRETVMHGLGLVTLLVGLQMALKTHNVLIVMGSVLAGGVLGEMWRIEERLEELGRWFESRLAQQRSPSAEGWSVSRAFVTASLVFCVGPLTFWAPFRMG